MPRCLTSKEHEEHKEHWIEKVQAHSQERTRAPRPTYGKDTASMAAALSLFVKNCSERET